MIKRFLHLFLAPLALLFQVIPAFLIYWTPKLAYGESKLLPEAWVWSFSMTWLLTSALVGLALGSTASYLLLTRSRGITASVLITIFCVPAWLLSVFYLHAALVFLAWV